jgi:hypothetical protein
VTPRLSLILCSRNDDYMGNARWRLETSLNYVGANVRALGEDGAVEVIVADWGSEVPLREALRLSREAAAMVSFVSVPPTVARELQGDSPFPEVLALNAAARRARGEYIGRIDQDTLVGARFLETFDRLHTGEQSLPVPLDSALLFSKRRDIPFEFSVRSPSMWAVTQFIRRFEPLLRVEREEDLPWYAASVGIWLLHRNLWDESGGFDERMIYMNNMERNMIERLTMKYELFNLGELVGHPFYHLDHYPPRGGRATSVYRKANPKAPFANPEILNPNGTDWGLSQCSLNVLPAAKQRESVPDSDRSVLGRVTEFVRLVAITGTTSTWYGVVKPIDWHRWESRRGVVFVRRVGTARQTVSGRPLIEWPSLLSRRWKERVSRPSRR